MNVACTIAALAASSSASAAIRAAIPAGRRDVCDTAARHARFAAMMNHTAAKVARERLIMLTAQYGNVMYPESTGTLEIENDFKKLMVIISLMSSTNAGVIAIAARNGEARRMRFERGRSPIGGT